MAQQLVFTSVPQGLTPGRTGYCTVARHRELRDRLVQQLEGISAYPSDWDPAPVICGYRLLDLGGATFPVLTRIVSAGQDYSHRAIFLAHHLVLDWEETKDAPPPAEIFMRWQGWRQSWDGPPRWFEAADWVDLKYLPPAPPPALPAQTWECLTNDAGKAALLLDGIKPRMCQLGTDPVGEEYLPALFRESSALLEPAQVWRAEFTTCLQPTESARSYRWSAVRLGSPADTTISRSGIFLDLTKPELLPAPNDDAMTTRARCGDVPPSPVPDPVAAISPIIAATTPFGTKLPPQVAADTIPAEPVPLEIKPAAKNDGPLLAGLAALVLLGLILVAVFALRGRSKAPIVLAASSAPPLAANPAPGPAPAVQPVEPVPVVVEISPPRLQNNYSLMLPGSLALELVWINPGAFTMGSAADDPNHKRDEGPPTQVTLTQGFWLGKYDVTQEQWSSLMGDTPNENKHKGAIRPEDNVSWDLAMDFCRRVTERERAAGRLPAGYEYTLPTEAQWEYAARAGGAESEPSDWEARAWYAANAGKTSHAVGLKQPNGRGLFDIHGNIMQWCRDWYANYPGGTATDFAGPATGTRHVARGGNFGSAPADLRDARRFAHPPNYQNNGVGLRLALAPAGN